MPIENDTFLCLQIFAFGKQQSKLRLVLAVIFSVLKKYGAREDSFAPVLLIRKEEYHIRITASN